MLSSGYSRLNCRWTNLLPSIATAITVLKARHYIRVRNILFHLAFYSERRLHDFKMDKDGYSQTNSKIMLCGCGSCRLSERRYFNKSVAYGRVARHSQASIFLPSSVVFPAGLGADRAAVFLFMLLRSLFSTRISNSGSPKTVVALMCPEVSDCLPLHLPQVAIGCSIGRTTRSVQIFKLH